MKKEFFLADGERIIVQKSARAKRMILKINHSNEAVVTIPRFAPYYAGVQFAKSQSAWIATHTAQKRSAIITPGARIGKSYTLVFKTNDKEQIKSHVRNNTITVTHPHNISPESDPVQKEARKAATRAIKKEADSHLPRILHYYATKHGYKYKEVRVKNMRSRWGSCSSEQSINLSIWLMQLPDDLIAYVCCHELTHLNHPHHQASFWEELAEMIPDWKLRRKKLKEYQPSLIIDSLQSSAAGE